MKPKRKYKIQRYYAVFCDVCNEDITDGEPTYTKADAEEARDIHEAWHRASDAMEAS